MVTASWAHAIPKVLLHDHLDGGVRPATLLSLASEEQIILPAETPEALEAWFWNSATSGDLETYLSTFEVINTLLQRPCALRRVAQEAVEDLAGDGVMYAELRYAPQRHIYGNMTAAESAFAVAHGIREGIRRVASRGCEIDVQVILCAVRNFDGAMAVADLVVNDRTGLVCAFDLAGGEAGAPPSKHAQAIAYVLNSGGNVTIHAGEIHDLGSVEEAVALGAHRLGHGVSLADARQKDTHGDLLSRVFETGLVLETCPTSNIQTGFCDILAEHPVNELVRAGFRVTINTDNRLLSRTSLSHELHSVASEFNWGTEELVAVTRNAIDGAFIKSSQKVVYHDRLSGWQEKVQERERD